jgi:hypothetical protein
VCASVPFFQVVKNMATYFLHRNSLGDTSDRGAERYRHDVFLKLQAETNGDVTAVAYGRWGNPGGVWFRFLDTLAAQVWDDNIADYGEDDEGPAAERRATQRYADRIDADDGGRADWIDKPCCGVYAVALIARVNFAEAWNLIRDQNGKGPRWQGKTRIPQVLTALRSFAVDYRKEHDGRGRSVKNFVENYTRPSGLYLIRTGGHFMVVDRQLVSDQTLRSVRPTTASIARRRVTHIYEIVTRPRRKNASRYKRADDSLRAMFG